MKRFILVFLLVLFLETGCEEKIYVDTTGENIIITNSKYEVYSDLKISDIIEGENGIEIINNEEVVNTDNLGNKEVKVLYNLDKKKYSYTFNIEIVDTKAPIVFGGTNKTVNLGYDGDLCNLIVYGDDYDGNLLCEISGDYDLNTSGTYKLLYKLIDHSGNTKEVNVTLNVVKPSSGNSTPSTPTEVKVTNFSDVVLNHKKENTEIGIDVSKWQGDIDYEKVKNAGATFVMMRIGVQAKMDGDYDIDRYYTQNIKNAKEAGLKVGVYFASRARSKEDAKKQAKWVIEKLNKEKLDLPISFDWENWSSWNSYKISFHEINEIANTFMDTVKEAGYEGMLYSSKFYLESIWTNKKEYPVWLAHYTSNTNYQGKYLIWQLCNNGRIDGINGDVDINVMYINE